MHDEPLPRRHRIGMLTPSSNTVLEPYTARMLEPLFPAVTAHFARFRVTRIALDDSASNQFRQEPILAAAELLADARTDIIAWNGTSASWLGFDTDARLCAEIEARTGVKATSCILGLNRLLAEGGVRRLGLVTPYTADVGARIAANYAAHGVEVVAGLHAGLSDNFSFADIADDQVGHMCAEVAAAKPDAIAIVCTNMRGARVGAEIERALGVPIIDSVAATLWGCLRALDLPTAPLAGFGSLFATPTFAGLSAPAPAATPPGSRR